MTQPVASGTFVAKHINDGDVPADQVQPNGVDLTVEEIHRISGKASFTDSGYDKPERVEMEPIDGNWRLYKGTYAVIYGEKIEIPDGYVGQVYPRSRLMRSGLHLTTALWDQGYEGIGEGQLQIPRHIEEVEIDVGLPIAQMVFTKADTVKDYDGTHQSERLLTGGAD
jgi:dUTP pyrophosphatase